MNPVSISAALRALVSPSGRNMLVVALVLALSMFSFYVHLLRASVHRGEAARTPQSLQAPAAAKPTPRPSRGR
jgi:hypothetical protein